MWLIELAAAVYLGSVLWPYAKRLRMPSLSVPVWVHNLAIAIIVLLILWRGFTGLFAVR